MGAFRFLKQAASTVETPGVGKVAVFVDSADGIMKAKDELGEVFVVANVHQLEVAVENEQLRAEEAEDEKVNIKEIGSTVPSKEEFSDIAEGAYGLWVPETENEARPTTFRHYIIIAEFSPINEEKYDIRLNPQGL